MKDIVENYIKNITETYLRGDAREESYYKHLEDFLKAYADLKHIRHIDITVLPKSTEAGNPDFRIWDGKNHITGYIEAKDISVTNLDTIETSAQLKRYISTFPNVILTNFYEFRLYRNGQCIAQTTVAQQSITTKLKVSPPTQKIEEFDNLLQHFFSFSLPKIQTASGLAFELAKRTRFLRDEIINVEINNHQSNGYHQIIGFYNTFKTYLINHLTEETFADLYAQTITYGLFAARTRANGEFNRRLAFDYIPRTIGILKDIFRFISLGDPPKSMEVIIDDIAEILKVTDVHKILHEYTQTGKGNDPIVHFYETFLKVYDPEVREQRGVYYTPEAVVKYIVRSIHSILKSHFNLIDGLASEEVKLLDPAGGTLTFPAEAIHLAAHEYKQKYGTGGLNNWIKNHILQNFYAFELMMAPYAIGHIKIGFILEELGYKMNDNERFKLYLTNTLEKDNLEKTTIPGLASLSEESHLAGEVKEKTPLLVILGNPPYSGISANINEWTERLLKEDVDGTQSYYKVDGHSLGEKKVWLQDDYVKFLRFAQWKIQKHGYGVVGMITNHSYLDNPTFRGMRQSLMKTFDEIYILDLHGNSLKKETAPDGTKDENVFDIRQGVAIGIFIRNKVPQKLRVYYLDLYGTREKKYKWLENNSFSRKNYKLIKPNSPWYLFVPWNTSNIREYQKWKRIDEIFPVNVTGIVTARDNLAIDFDKSSLERKIALFRNEKLTDDMVRDALQLKDNYQWKLSEQRKLFQSIKNWQQYFTKILYRPFDVRYIYYQDNIVFRPRREVMRHMLEGNIGLLIARQMDKSGIEPVFITQYIVDAHSITSATSITCLFPLYLYPDKPNGNSSDSDKYSDMLFEPEEVYNKRANIHPSVLESLTTAYHQTPSPEEILYYIYAILYSNIYCKTYTEFLKMDFPRIPFTTKYKLFKQLSELGNQLVDLHLLKSKDLSSPIVKYQGKGTNDKIEKIVYDEHKKRVYINADKYFEPISPEVWNYPIGGYQVVQKYLKDRKGRDIGDPREYSYIVTAIIKTMEIQKQIDKLYPKVEESNI